MVTTQRPVRAMTLDDVAEAVCEYFTITKEELRGPSQRVSVAYPRSVFSTLSRSLTRFSADEVGAYLGRTRWTVWKGAERLDIARRADESVRYDIDAVLAAIRLRRAAA